MNGVLARQDGDDIDTADVRAGTRLIRSVSEEFVSGALGCLTARLHRSLDDEDRGGVVLELTMRDDGGGAFLPHAVNSANGCSIHLCGDAEGEALLHALRALLGLSTVPR